MKIKNGDCKQPTKNIVMMVVKKEVQVEGSSEIIKNVVGCDSQHLLLAPDSKDIAPVLFWGDTDAQCFTLV